MAKRQAGTCPKCGGHRRGQGYPHKETCPDYKARGGGRRGSGGNIMASLRGMDVQALLSLGGDLDELILSKAGK